MIPLVDIVFDATLVLAAGLLATLLLRRRSAALRHSVLQMAMLCAVLTPAAEPLLPSWGLPFDIAIAAPAAAPAAMRPVANAPSSGAAASRAAAPAPAAAWPFPGVVFAVWFAGTALIVATLIVGLLRLAHLTRRSRLLTGGVWVTGLEHLRRAQGVRRAIAVRETSHPRLLLVWGWRRPTLLVPQVARDWDEERVFAVLRHELAHVGRNDWISQLAAELVRAVYWFNPVVWFACARLHVECERACDDTVIAAGVDGPRYASHLLDIARDLRRGAIWVPAPAIVRASTLERRVKAMLDRTIDRRPVSRRVRATAGASLLAVSAIVATVAAAQQFSTITGTIVDPSNALLPGVTLFLTNEETHAKYEISTDRTGRYQFVGLPPGTYRLESKLPGFAVFRTTLTVGAQPVQQDVMLPVGALEETVTVTWSPDEAPDAAGTTRNGAPLAKRPVPPCGPPPPPGTAVIGGNIRAPRKVTDVKPLFPVALQGTRGEVVLLGRIGTDGDVISVDVLSSTHAQFAEAAIDAVKRWQFDATLLNCRPTEVQMTVNVHFRSE